jgi:hypothetical protein
MWIRLTITPHSLTEEHTTHVAEVVVCSSSSGLIAISPWNKMIFSFAMAIRIRSSPTMRSTHGQMLQRLDLDHKG